MRPLLGLLAGVILALTVACGGGGNDASDRTPTPTGGGGGAAATTPATSATQAPSGGGGSSSSTGALPDACTLLTEAQVSAAMAEGIATKRGEPPTAALSRCQWDGTTSGRRYVYVTIRQAQFGTSVFNNSFKSRADGRALSGIGKEAIAIPGQNTPNDYRFLTGAILTDTLFIQVDVAGPNRDDAQALSTLTTVMQTLAGNAR